MLFNKKNPPNGFYVYSYLREDLTPYYIGKGSGTRAWKKTRGEIGKPTDETRIVILNYDLSEEESFYIESNLIEKSKYYHNPKGIPKMATIDQLKEIFHGAKEENLDKFCDALNEAMNEFEINTPHREAMFLAQCGHESGMFSAVSENLNYKAETLTKVFPKYFRDVNPDDFSKQPEKIANRVYASRMGNGDEESGDGFRFRGRGLIQLTGKSNYTRCGEALGKDLTTDSDYLSTPEGAARSAAWFFQENGCNETADADDVIKTTKIINGGTIGLEERTELYNKAKSVLGA